MAGLVIPPAPARPCTSPIPSLSPPAACCHPVVADLSEHRDFLMATDTAVTASRPPTARDKAPCGLACGYFVSPCGSRTACDLAGPCVVPVIHFSTATIVHSCGEVDQRVYVNHPQAYPQDVSLTRPRAGVIRASSHAGPGFPCARSGQRRPCLDRTLIMPRTARRPRLRQPLPHRRTEPGGTGNSQAA